MTVVTTIGTLRIAGGGISSSRYTAHTVDERRALIDRELDRLATGRGGVMYLEIDRAGDDFAALDRFRGVVGSSGDGPDPELIEFMRVGVAGDIGAAEYVRFRLDGTEQAFYATHNPNPISDQPRVLYDDCVPTYFPPETVVPLATVRQLMRDFALRGEWSHVTVWLAHEDMVA